MPTLDREEYVEQIYFFRTYRERLAQNLPAQEILCTIREEILSTTKLPFALDFLYDEIKHRGRIGESMMQLTHYFTPFQTFVISRAEDDKARFDLPIGLLILEREAAYRIKDAVPAGMFIYQFECLSRNRLGYDAGMQAIADDPIYNEQWKDWILRVKRQLGTRDFADFVYLHSQFALEEYRREQRDPDLEVSRSILFGIQEGRIAKANRKKDPLHMFAALQRHLNYPEVPRARARSDKPDIHPALETRLLRLEQRIKLIEMEANNSFDITKLAKKNLDFGIPEVPDVPLSGGE
jgi:hypothetical protein